MDDEQKQIVCMLQVAVDAINPVGQGAFLSGGTGMS